MRNFVKKGTNEYWNQLYESYANQRNKLKAKGEVLTQQLGRDDFKTAYSQVGEIINSDENIKKRVGTNYIRALINDSERIISTSDMRTMLNLKEKGRLSKAHIKAVNLLKEDLQDMVNENIGKEYNYFGNRGVGHMSQAQALYAAMVDMEINTEEVFGY